MTTLPQRPGLWILALCALFPVAAAATAPTALVYHDDPPQVSHNPAEQALLKSLAPLVGVAKLDPVLSQAAAVLLRGVPARDALQSVGASDAFALPMTWNMGEGRGIGAVEELLRTEIRRAAPTHYGLAVTGTTGAQRAGLIFVRRGAELSRFPKMLETGDGFLLNGRLAKGLKKPSLLVAAPNGHVSEYTPRYEHGIFWHLVRFGEGPGRYIVEVQAVDRYGAQVLSLMEVHAVAHGEPLKVPVTRLRPPPREPESTEAAENRALQLINRSRKQAGLAQLAGSARAAAEARSHAKDMALRGFFGHVSPTRGGLSRRLKRAGLSVSLARENVAIAPSPEWAHTELLRSPSHLRNILDPDVTHVGVGVYQTTSDHPVYTFAQIFTAAPRR